MKFSRVNREFYLFKDMSDCKGNCYKDLNHFNAIQKSTEVVFWLLNHLFGFFEDEVNNKQHEQYLTNKMSDTVASSNVVHVKGVNHVTRSHIARW